jgi:hypothetical protein
MTRQQKEIAILQNLSWKLGKNHVNIMRIGRLNKVSLRRKQQKSMLILLRVYLKNYLQRTQINHQ